MNRPAAIILAAGAGRRFGGPKALARDADGTPWLHRVVDALTSAADPVIVVLGAESEQARELVPETAVSVVADQWQFGMSGSLVAGLAAARSTESDAVLVALVDQPGMLADVVARVLGESHDVTTLRRAAVHDEPRHPVLIGRDHWAAIARQAAGDTGARDYLANHDVTLIEVGDLWDGADHDHRPS